MSDEIFSGVIYARPAKGEQPVALHVHGADADAVEALVLRLKRNLAYANGVLSERAVSLGDVDDGVHGPARACRTGHFGRGIRWIDLEGSEFDDPYAKRARADAAAAVRLGTPCHMCG